MSTVLEVFGQAVNTAVTVAMGMLVAGLVLAGLWMLFFERKARR